MIYLDIKIPHLQIAHQGGNLEVGNIKIHHVSKNASLPPPLPPHGDDDDDALDVDDNDDNNGGYVGYAMVISRFPTYI